MSIDRRISHDEIVALSAVGEGAARLYVWILVYHAEHSYMPSHREMAEGLGVSSVNSIRAWLGQLQKVGLVVTDFAVARGLILPMAEGDHQCW